ADVDALRSAIGEAIVTRADAIRTGSSLVEPDGILGNLIGQAITRNIAVDDLVRLDDASVVDERTAQSIIRYLHFYEGVRFLHAADEHYAYTPTVYPPAILAFITAHGQQIADVLRVDADGQGGIAGGPSGCYNRTAFAQGMTELTGQTNIWVEGNHDDES